MHSLSQLFVVTKNLLRVGAPVLTLALLTQSSCATVRPTVEVHAFGRMDPDADQRTVDAAVKGKSPATNVQLIDTGLASIDRDNYDVLGTVLVEEKSKNSLAWRNVYWVNDFESRNRYTYCAVQAPFKAITLGLWNVLPPAWFCMAANPDSSNSRLKYMLPYVRRASAAMGGDTAVLLNTLSTESVQTLGSGWHNENVSFFTTETGQTVLRDTGVKFLILRKRQATNVEQNELDTSHAR